MCSTDVLDIRVPELQRGLWLQVVVPTRVGQVYVYDTGASDQDEYDVPPRHQPSTQQDVYDVPPARQQYSTQVRSTCVDVGGVVSVSECAVRKTYPALSYHLHPPSGSLRPQWALIGRRSKPRASSIRSS